MRKRTVSGLAAVGALTLVLAACGSGGSGGDQSEGSGDSGGTTANSSETGASSTAESGDESKSAGNSGFPDGTINIVVPYAPGGASDLTARIFAKSLSDELGTSVSVSNVTGASGATGLEKVKNSKADGYTIAYIPVESTMIKALGFTDISSADFTFLGRIMTIPAAITVQESSPWKNLDDFIAAAKKDPGSISVGNSGTGSIWQIATASLGEAAGAKFTYVPFDGAAPAVSALVGGNIDAVGVSPSEVQSNVDDGKLKTIAVLSDHRSTIFPDVPTAAEQGYDVEIQGWGAFGVPKGTPDDVVEALRKASKVAMNSDDVKKFLLDHGFEPAYLDGPAMEKEANEELQHFAKLIPELGIAQG